MSKKDRRCTPPCKKKSPYWSRLEYRVKRALSPEHFPLSHRQVVLALIRLLYHRNRCAGPITNSTLERETGLSPRELHYCLINLRLKRVIWMKRFRITPGWDKPHLIGLLSNTKNWKPKRFSKQWLKSVKARARARVRCESTKLVQALHPTLPLEGKGGEGEGSKTRPLPSPIGKSSELAGGIPPRSKASTPPGPRGQKEVSTSARGTAATPAAPSPATPKIETHAENTQDRELDPTELFLRDCLRTNPGLRQRLREILANPSDAEPSDVPPDLPELCLTDATSLW